MGFKLNVQFDSMKELLLSQAESESARWEGGVRDIRTFALRTTSMAQRNLGAEIDEQGAAGALCPHASTVNKAVAKGGELDGLEGLKKKLLG